MAATTEAVFACGVAIIPGRWVTIRNCADHPAGEFESGTVVNVENGWIGFRPFHWTDGEIAKRVEQITRILM